MTPDSFPSFAFQPLVTPRTAERENMVYAVRGGRDGPGVYSSWDECRPQILGAPNAEYQVFKDRAEAQKYIQQKAESPQKGEESLLDLYQKANLRLATSNDGVRLISQLPNNHFSSLLQDVRTQNKATPRGTGETKYYGVRNGRDGNGVFTSWQECREQVLGFPDASFHAFGTDYEAKEFIA